MILNDWTKKKIGEFAADTLARENLQEYQLFMTKKTMSYAKENSKYYAELFSGFDIEGEIRSLDDIVKVPTTSAADLKARGTHMLCVSQNEISRIVTLQTSGSSDAPKRVYFTQEDQELTVDYFHHGMQAMVGAGDVFLTLLPCERPGSVGDLLNKGLSRAGIRTIPYGHVSKIDEGMDEEVLKIMREEGVTSLVAGPFETSRLAEKSKDDKIIYNNMKSVLLSTEFVPRKCHDTIKKSWGCQVFEHYGMTEMGLGGAMACSAHAGYHPREVDLYFEIIDPVTEKPVPDGQWGEIAFTTLTRAGMPFIRYRTGDTSRWLSGECSCGSIFRRIDIVRERGVEKARG